jgi:hypothetical protein
VSLMLIVWLLLAGLVAPSGFPVLLLAIGA